MTGFVINSAVYNFSLFVCLFFNGVQQHFSYMVAISFIG